MNSGYQFYGGFWIRMNPQALLPAATPEAQAH
jgi:hypothetical protein